MNFLAILQAAPAVFQAIKTIETLVPVQSQGTAKLDAVIQLVTISDQELEALAPQLTKAANVIFNLIKATGLLPTTLTPPTA